jgi:hypothetical protein
MRNVEYDKIYGIIEPFMNVGYMVYQLKYDSVHKRYPGTVCSKKDGDEVHLVVYGVEITGDLTKCIDAPVYSIDSENKETRIAHPTMLSSRDGHQEREARFVAHIMKPKAGYGYPAPTAHFAAESSTGTNVNVCTTDDFTKSVDAILTLSQSER